MDLGRDRLRRRTHRRAELVVSARHGEPTCTSTKTEKPFVSDAFTNPAHVHFALKVTFATMFCYISYMAIDWFGIHTALITCTFIALESTGATLHKGVLRMGGCIIGGALALFTIVFLMPHMVTIASLVVVVARASAIAGWVATGSEMISYAGLQIAFAFFYSVFQGYVPDTDLDNVRNRVVGILFGLIVTGTRLPIHLARAHDRPIAGRVASGASTIGAAGRNSAPRDFDGNGESGSARSDSGNLKEF